MFNLRVFDWGLPQVMEIMGIKAGAKWRYGKLYELMDSYDGVVNEARMQLIPEQRL